MLECVSCKILKVNFKNIILNFLWVSLCFKVGDNVSNVLCSGVTLTWVQNPTQIRSILVEINEKVLATITIKKYGVIISFDAGSGKVL